MKLHQVPKDEPSFAELLWDSYQYPMIIDKSLRCKREVLVVTANVQERDILNGLL